MAPAGVELIEGELATGGPSKASLKPPGKRTNPSTQYSTLPHSLRPASPWCAPSSFSQQPASTLSLLEAMLACGPRRLVFSSTAAVYGEPEAVPIQEDAHLVPTNPYGHSKYLVEQILTWFNRIHGLRYASLRYFNVAGAPEAPGGITRGEAHQPESHLFRSFSTSPLDAVHRSASSAATTPLPMAPASATTSTSRIWPTRTCWRSVRSTLRPEIRARSSTTLATGRDSVCRM